MKTKHVVIYLGVGIWKDQNSELWGKGSSDKSIIDSRTYMSDSDQEGFLDERGDIKFMVEYGQMKIESIGAPIEDGTPAAPADKQSTPAPQPKQGVTIIG